MKKMLERQMKDLPKDQQEKLTTLIQNNPKLFETIAKEMQHKIKVEKKDQMVAMMEVVKRHRDEIQKAMAGLQ